MSTYNAGLLYYKHYYEQVNWNEKDKNEPLFRKRNATLLATRFLPDCLPPINAVTTKQQPGGTVPYCQNFELTTTYPGLILGTGYTHGSGLLGEFKTGFFFDHTTGLPVIPGSSVKGLLRSVFPAKYYEQEKKYIEKKQPDEAAFWEKLGDNRTKFVAALLKNLQLHDNADRAYIEQLEYEIFEGMHGTNREKEEHHFPMRERDIFFDAVVVRSADTAIFEEDYITPHKKPLKNPIPIQLLKVRPGVTFQFQFQLKAHYTPDTKQPVVRPRLLTPAQRLDLFHQILLFLGAGAKTNTGYGQFASGTSKVDLSQPKTGSGNDKTPVGAPMLPKTEPTDYKGTIRQGEKLEAKVVALTPKKRVSLKVNGEVYEAGASGNCPAVGTVCKVSISDVDKKTKRIIMVAYAGPLA